MTLTISTESITLASIFIILGLFFALVGKRIFRLFLMLTGAIIGFTLASLLCSVLEPDLLTPAVNGVLSSKPHMLIYGLLIVACGALALITWRLAVFAAVATGGFAFGSLLVASLGTRLPEWSHSVVPIGFALIFGLFSSVVDELIIRLACATIGATLLVCGYDEIATGGTGLYGSLSQTASTKNIDSIMQIPNGQLIAVGVLGIISFVHLSRSGGTGYGGNEK